MCKATGIMFRQGVEKLNKFSKKIMKCNFKKPGGFFGFRLHISIFASKKTPKHQKISVVVTHSNLKGGVVGLIYNPALDKQIAA
jgi:hypothetical protein